MKIKINDNMVNVKFVDYLGGAAGTFHSLENIIRITKNYHDIKSVIIHELTHAYLYYYGFAGVELSEELVCNFMEIYGEKIIKESERIVKWQKRI